MRDVAQPKRPPSKDFGLGEREEGDPFARKGGD